MSTNSPKFSPTRSAELLVERELLPHVVLPDYWSASTVADPMFEQIVHEADQATWAKADLAAVRLGWNIARKSPSEIAAQHRIAVEVIKRVLPYARHKEDCKFDVMPGKFRTCTCGLSEALSLIGE